MAHAFQAVFQTKENISDFAFKYTFERPSSLEYQAGQFFTLHLSLQNHDPRGNTRHFSFSSSPTEKEIFSFASAQGISEFKKTLQTLPKGTQVTIEGPYGNFTLPRKESRPILFLAGGTGITPFRGMMKFAIDTTYPTPITLLYSSQTPNAILFRDELEQFATYPTITITHTITRPEKLQEHWSGKTGRIHEESIRRHVKDIKNTRIFICGNPSMVTSLRSVLMKMGAPAQQIKIESFTGYNHE